jgi:hypothetical protein
MRSITALALSLMVAGIAACAATEDSSNDSASDEVHTAASSNAVQMNDVSIVLPLAKNAQELDGGYLKASTSGVGGALIPQDIYTKNTGFGVDPPAHIPVGGDVGMPYSQLRAVAYRIDPCFAQIGPITDEGACDNQLRVVFQALTLSGTAGAADGAIHAFYRLTRDQLKSLLDDVVAARVANGGTGDLGPVQVHPIVVKQGLLGAESKALQTAVLKYAGTSSFMRFTMFKSSNLQTVWNFAGFDIANGKATPMVIPTMPNQGTGDEFFAGFAASLSGGFQPATTSTDANMQLLGKLSDAQAASKEDVQKAIDATYKIENPDMSSPNTIDCASCHMAGVSRALTAVRDMHLTVDGNPNEFKADPKWVSAADFKATTPVTGAHGINLHMFSYRGSDLMIGQRVVNESAGVVALVNSTIRPL